MFYISGKNGQPAAKPLIKSGFTRRSNTMEQLKTIGSCQDNAGRQHGSGREKRLQDDLESRQLKERMEKISHKIMVLSGKGGVGKSTVAVNLALALALEGKRVGILDLDFHGPSIPKLLHLEGAPLKMADNQIIPVEFAHGIQVMSMGFLLPNENAAVIWRGPIKMGAIKQLLSEVCWGELDYLIIDFPPGTGDEALSAAQLLPESDGAVIVTTPQDLSLTDVRKSIDFCRQVKVPIIGVIENMSGLACPHCRTLIDVFKQGGGEIMAKELNVPFLCRIPLEPLIVKASDQGTPFIHYHGETEAAKAFSIAVTPLLNLKNNNEDKNMKTKPATTGNASAKSVKIAVPIENGRLCNHFGHCENFALMDVDRDKKIILRREDIPAPPHEPGLLPRWLQERGVNTIIAGGMGSRALGLFAERGIQVIVGAAPGEPEAIVRSHLDGVLVTGQNVCDH
jgi:Mrp family chromosome partitioning ATPase/predicted Fe-Mo cluster-binding NifX family protein